MRKTSSKFHISNSFVSVRRRETKRVEVNIVGERERLETGDSSHGSLDTGHQTLDTFHHLMQ